MVVVLHSARQGEEDKRDANPVKSLFPLAYSCFTHTHSTLCPSFELLNGPLFECWPSPLSYLRSMPPRSFHLLKELDTQPVEHALSRVLSPIPFLQNETESVQQVEFLPDN